LLAGGVGAADGALSGLLLHIHAKRLIRSNLYLLPLRARG
jgi:hypothetical protein